jgi:hypothetical protein
VNHFLSAYRHYQDRQPDWDYSAARHTCLLRVLVSFFLCFDVENCGWQDVNGRNWSSSLIVDGIIIRVEDITTNSNKIVVKSFQRSVENS